MPGNTEGRAPKVHTPGMLSNTVLVSFGAPQPIRFPIREFVVELDLRLGAALQPTTRKTMPGESCFDSGELIATVFDVLVTALPGQSVRA